MSSLPQWLPERRYHLPLRQSVHGARDHHALLTGSLVGRSLPHAQGWMTRPDLPNRPQWKAAIAQFARAVALDQLEAAAAHQSWPTRLARRWGTTVRPAIELALTADLDQVADGFVDAELQATGCKAIKIKVNRDDDAARLRAHLAPLRQSWPDVTVRLDANQSWNALPEAALQARLQVCAELGVASVEDPTTPQRWPRYTPVALAADLLDMDLERFWQLVEQGAVQLAVVKPALLGDLDALGALLHRLAAAGVPVAISSLFDAPRGLAALAAIAAASPGTVVAAGLMTHRGLDTRWRPPALETQQGRWLTADLWASDGACHVPAHLGDAVAQMAAARPDAPALTWLDTSGQSWTWRQWHHVLDACAWWLDQHAQGDGPIAVWSDNRPALAAVFQACERLGRAVAPLHPRATAAEVAVLLDRLRPSLVLADRPLAGAQSLPDWTTLAAPPQPITYAFLEPQRIAAIVATSGTTGQPKLARLSAGALAHAAAAHWALDRPASPLPHDEKWLTCLPLCHVSGLLVLARAAAVGAHVVMTPDSSVESIVQAMDSQAVSTVSLVPTLLRRLLDRGVRPSTVRLALLGGASLDPQLHADAQVLGWPVVASYGMTETCAQVASGSPTDEPAARAGLRRVGPPLPGIWLQTSPQGEILIAGAQLLTDYLDDPRATAAALQDGWLSTGDTGEIDADGVLWVASRRADRIITGGENVDPLEIEEVLARIAGVRAVVAVGLRDAERGQIVGVWLQVADLSIDWPSRCADALRQLAPYKRPRHWHMTPDPPSMNSLGKVLRGQVADSIEKSRSPAA